MNTSNYLSRLRWPIYPDLSPCHHFVTQLNDTNNYNCECVINAHQNKYRKYYWVNNTEKITIGNLTNPYAKTLIIFLYNTQLHFLKSLLCSQIWELLQKIPSFNSVWPWLLHGLVFMKIYWVFICKIVIFIYSGINSSTYRS